MQHIKFLWITIGVVLLFLFFLEGTAGLAFFVKNKLYPKPVDYRMAAEGYQDVEWTEGHFRELHACSHVQWHPYVHHRRCAFKGKYINIDDQGRRYTWNPQSNKSDTPIKIFVFGGSSIWGTGARDEYTIPSLISKILAQSQDRRVEVTNFGESGHNSTQALITLMLELRKGNIPDLVIYYGGINDVAATYQNQLAGIPQNEENRRAEFNITYSRKRLFLMSLITFTKYSHIYRTYAGLKRKFMKPNLSISSRHRQNIDYLQLAQDTVDIYSENLRMFTILGEVYGFKTLFYWNPAIFAKNSLSTYEEKEAQKASCLKEFYLTVYNGLKQNKYLSGNQGFRDMSSVFQRKKQSIFNDYIHLTEDGNGIVARRIADDILEAEYIQWKEK